MPYGGAPKWSHTSGNGLHANVLPIGIGDDVTIAGFIRQDAGSSGHRYVWQANTTARSLRVSADGSLRARLDGRTLNAPAGTIADNTWHHVAVTRTTSRVRLVVDGVEIVNVVGQTATPIDSLQWSMARADGNEPVNLALDEWGIWSEVLDVAALYARRTHHRAFGGYVYGVVDATDLGPADQHVLSLSLAGYGLRLDHSYVRQIYASASGSTIREIVQDVLERAGLDDVFSSHGVELDDTVTRAVYPVQSVMTILR